MSGEKGCTAAALTSVWVLWWPTRAENAEVASILKTLVIHQTCIRNPACSCPHNSLLGVTLSFWRAAYTIYTLSSLQRPPR